jgi:sugar phosphate isomerase/epimerase
MWGINNFARLDDFFIAAERFGFAKIELNHQVTSAMLAGVGLKKYLFSSVHEPCPADLSTEALKNRDWLISSADEECRRQGVAAVKRSIDLASELSAQTVVLHAGTIRADGSLEIKLRDIFQSGQDQSPEYMETKKQLVDVRARSSGPHLEAVKKSLLELLEYAGHCNIRLGLENRYHYFDIPTQDEMSLFLDLAGPEELGFIYDVGHAQAMERLGFYPHEMWLKRYTSRIIGVHLHDVIGISDHYAPGLGEVDFHMVAAYLPRDAYRACELQSFNTAEQVTNGLKFLVDAGCVNLIQ